MNALLHTRIRRAVAAVVAGVLAALAGPAFGADRPASSYYTPQQLEAMSQSWAARGGVFTNRPASSFYTPQQLQAMSQSWAARGGVFVDRPASSYYTPQQLQAISQSWAARARHAGGAPSAAVGGDGFDWGDFGIGAAAMLGLVLLGGGLAVGGRLSRKGGIRARTVS